MKKHPAMKMHWIETGRAETGAAERGFTARAATETLDSLFH